MYTSTFNLCIQILCWNDPWIWERFLRLIKLHLEGSSQNLLNAAKAKSKYSTRSRLILQRRSEALRLSRDLRLTREDRKCVTSCWMAYMYTVRLSDEKLPRSIEAIHNTTSSSRHSAAKLSRKQIKLYTHTKLTQFRSHYKLKRRICNSS